MTCKDFLELRALIAIAHHIPGRIRLKLDPRIVGHPAARALASLSGGKPEAGLLGARVNILARSLILEYDLHTLSPEELETFLAGADAEKAAQLAEKVAGLLGISLQC